MNSESFEILSGVSVPRREGPRPETSEAPKYTLIAHQQVTQNTSEPLQEELFKKVKGLLHVTSGPSKISVPGARAFFLPEEKVAARLSYGTEFAHLHPGYDGSLHVNLDPEVIERITASGWGEPHPRVPWAAMLYGPHDEQELEVVWQLIQLSYRYAIGELEGYAEEVVTPHFEREDA